MGVSDIQWGCGVGGDPEEGERREIQGQLVAPAA